jgi:CheY-like chemotaxis protein
MPENGSTWRFLIVEDNPGMVKNIEDILPTCVPAGDTAEYDSCLSFDDAKKRMINSHYDLLILDLKDDDIAFPAVDADPPGVTVFQELKKYRFTPVVFYTGWAEKVRDYETSFVKVVEKTEDVTVLRKAIQDIFATRLPVLAKLIDEVERKYLWDFISTNWREPNTQFEQSDLAHLVARRLSIALIGKLSGFANSLANPQLDDVHKETVHPMEVYIYPPIGTQRMAGDIVYEKEVDPKCFWLVLTPACDFVHTRVKAEHILLARCEELQAQQEFYDWAADRTKKEKLEHVIRNRRCGKRSVVMAGSTISVNLQPERFRFLPGTFFIPDLVVDFQQLKTISYCELNKYDIAASLDSPYAEWIVTSFASFFGRVGTPDIDKDMVLKRAEALLGTKAVAQPESPPDRGVKDEAAK